MNNQKKKKKTKKKTTAVVENADDYITSAEYQKTLIDYDEQLAGIKSKIVRLAEAIDKADVEYVRVRKQYESVVKVHARENAEQLAEINELEAEKYRLKAVISDPQTIQAREELVDRRHEQYERALADLNFESMDVQAKYDSKFNERTELNTLLDDISSASNCKKIIENNHQYGLYTANKKQNIRIALLSYELEKEFGSMVEEFLMDDETSKATQTIIEYYDTINNIIKSQKQNLMEHKQLELLENKNLFSTTMHGSRIQFLKRSINSIEKDISELKKKKEMYLNSQ